MKPPFGIAQIGKSFRNEITPGNFIFRTREFEQMEMEFFVKPGEDEEWHQYWIDERTRWYVDLGIDPENLRHYEHPQEKLQPLLQAHRRHRVPLQLRRLRVGRARGHRQPHRLRPHHALQALRARTCPTSTRPPTSATCRTSSSRPPASRRSLMTFLVDAYNEDEAPNTKGGVDKRTVLRLDPRLAPVKVAVLPLSPQRRPVARRPRRSPPSCAQQLERRLRRLRRDRPPLPPPGRDRHAVLRDRRLRHPRGQRGDRARARHDEAGAGLPRRHQRATFAERLLGCLRPRRPARRRRAGRGLAAQ